MSKKNIHVRKTLMATIIDYLYPDRRAELQEATRTYFLGQTLALVNISHRIKQQPEADRAKQEEAFKETCKAYGLYRDQQLHAVGLYN